MFFLETSGPWNPEQNVHEDWVLVLAGEEGLGNNLLAKVLLSVHQREQVRREGGRYQSVTELSLAGRSV